MGGRRYVADVGRAVGTFGGRRRYDGGAGDGRYAAGKPVLGFGQGQVLVGDAARRRVAISNSVKALRSDRGREMVATAAGSKVPVLAELMIALTADRIAIVAALNGFGDQILVDGALRVLIAAVAGVAATVDARRCFRGRRD